jgi:2-methylisocitrate lyase-like PEP mutase family enzyme
MVEGGVTPIIPATELAEMGYRIVLYANALQRLACAAAIRGLAVLQQHGTTTPIVDEMLGWRERQTIVGLPAWQAFEENVLRRADGFVGKEDPRSSDDREDQA